MPAGVVSTGGRTPRRSGKGFNHRNARSKCGANETTSGVLRLWSEGARGCGQAGNGPTTGNGRERAARVASPADSDRFLSEEHRQIRRAQQGDRPAFARLVETYYDRLYRWLYHLGHDRHLAEDLTQE